MTRRRADRSDQRVPAGARRRSPSMQIDSAADLRRPGRHRHRERAAVQRGSDRVTSAGAADRDGRHPEGHQPLGDGCAAGVRGNRRQHEAAARRLLGRGVPLHDGIAYLEAITPTNPTAERDHEELSFPRPVAVIVCAIVQSGTIAQVPDTDALSGRPFGTSREGAAFAACFLRPADARRNSRSAWSVVTRVQTGTFPANRSNCFRPSPTRR